MANRIFTSKGVQGVSSAEEAASTALERDPAVQEEANRRILAILDAFCSGEPEALAKAMGALRALRLA